MGRKHLKIHALRLNTVLSEELLLLLLLLLSSLPTAVREISLAMHAWVANP